MKRTWLILNTQEYDYMIQCRNFNQINILNAVPKTFGSKGAEKKMFHSQITENKISASQRLSVQSNKCSKRITKI